MQRSILIITSDDIRHNYFRIMFSNAAEIKVIKTFVESERPFILNKKRSNCASGNL